MSQTDGYAPQSSSDGATALIDCAAPSVGTVAPSDTVVANGVSAALQTPGASNSHAAQCAASLRMEPRYASWLPVSASLAPATDERHPVVAFGPELTGFGSWEWVGRDLADALVERFEIVTFRDEPPECDVLVLVKWRPALDVLQRAARRSAIVYCPIDLYGSAAEIDADWRSLRLCRRIIVHGPDLAKYFGSYAPVDVLDHHVKYTTPLRESFVEDGPILWTGVWSDLPPLVDLVNAHRLPAELCVLTNLTGRDSVPVRTYGFRDESAVRIENWTPERHLERLSHARGVIDIKGQDFRARHKPASKAIDTIASGVPLAMNSDSSSTAYLKTLGFDVAVPENTERWLSRAYWEQTRALGAQLRERMSLHAVADRMAGILNEVHNAREARCA